MAKKDFPDDCAFVYRGARVYHTLRDLSAGRQNATCSENWLTWKFSDRDMDSPEGNQFDLRELSNAPSGYKPVAAHLYVSALLTADDAKRPPFFTASLSRARAAVLPGAPI